MKAYILASKRERLLILEYIKENDIQLEVLTLSEFEKLADMPAILFFVKYNFQRKNQNLLAKRNKMLSGYNISILGDEEINIDQRITSLEEVNEILQRVKSIYLKEKVKERALEGNVLLISSAKAGIGKSFIAFNLAYFLSLFKKGKKVLILDYNLSASYLSKYFYHNQSGLDILIEQYINYGKIDREYLKDVILRNPKLNFNEEYLKIDVLLSNNLIESAININKYPKFTYELIKMLKSMYDLILVDTSSEKTLSYSDILINEADKVFFLISPNTGTIIQTKELLIELDLDKFIFIYNQYSKGREVFALDILSEEFFGKSLSLKELKNAFYILDFSNKIEESDNYFIPIFHSSNSYINFDEREKYRLFFYSILNRSFPGFVIKPKIKKSLMEKYFSNMISSIDTLFSKFRALIGK